MSINEPVPVKRQSFVAVKAADKFKSIGQYVMVGVILVTMMIVSYSSIAVVILLSEYVRGL